MIEKEIVFFGREIVQSLSNTNIPFTDINKCKVFSVDWYIPKWAVLKGSIDDCPVRRHSHVVVTWNAQPHKNSSILWVNLKQIRSEQLVALINSIKRDKKLEKVLK